MKIYSALLLVISILLPNYTFSQLLKPGYVITNQNDTLRGFIKENVDKELVKFIFFAKEKDNSKLVKYERAQLKEFGFNNGRIFEKLSVKEFIIKDSVEVEYFAKRILTGKILAYIIEGARKETELLLKNQTTGKMVHLKKPEMYEAVGSDGTSVFSSDRKYLQHIALVKKDSPNDSVKQDNFKYSTKKIIRHVKKYDLSYKDRFPTHRYKEQVQIAFGVLGGTRLIAPPVSRDRMLYGAYGLSAFIDYTPIEHTRRVAFTQGISYSKVNRFRKMDDTYYNGYYFFHSQILSIYPLGIKFQATRGSITPYIYMGVGMMYIKNNGVYWNDREKEFKIGFNMGGGLKIKIVSKLYVITELNFKNVEGFYANGGIVYQFITREKQYSRFIK
ncbi:MAG TPA: hypothetical protein PK289_03875 [Bacteroidia bacterium]|nr:hypothetical protein [Bacteroidia bacterium]